MLYIKYFIYLFVLSFFFQLPSLAEDKLGHYSGRHLSDDEACILEVPADFELLQINEKKKSSFSLFNGGKDRAIKLVPGKYKVWVKYYVIWEYEDEDEHEPIESEMKWVEFEGGKGSRYSVKHLVPDTLEAAKSYAKNFRPEVICLNKGEEITTTVLVKASSKRRMTSKEREHFEEVKKMEKHQLDSLKYWWSQAGFEVRQQFLEWIQPKGKA